MSNSQWMGYGYGKGTKKEENAAYGKIIDFLLGLFLFWICEWDEVFLSSPKQKMLANSTSLWWLQSCIYILPVHWAGICHFLHHLQLAAVIGGGGQGAQFLILKKFTKSSKTWNVSRPQAMSFLPFPSLPGACNFYS